MTVRSRVLGLLTASGVVLAACADPTGLARVDRASARSAARSSLVPSATLPQDAHYVARGIAGALARPALRAQLRNAMRESRWTDHKLVLQEFVRTHEGAALLAASAEALGTTAEAFVAVVGRLPAMDFYVPFRAHRLSWRGSPDVVVAAAFDGDAPTLQAFTPDGQARTLSLADGAPAATLLILHPSEPKALRDLRNRPRIGETIQDPGEGGVGVMWEPCNDPYCDSSGSPTTAGVYLTQFYSYRDDGWYGSLEMEFRSFGWQASVQYLGNENWYYGAICGKGTGTATVEPQQTYTNQLVLVSAGVTSVNVVTCGQSLSPNGYGLFVVESDGGLNFEDDDFGRRHFYPGSIPFGATIGTTQSYYSGGGTASDGQLSVTARLEYR